MTKTLLFCNLLKLFHDIKEDSVELIVWRDEMFYPFFQLGQEDFLIYVMNEKFPKWLMHVHNFTMLF